MRPNECVVKVVLGEIEQLSDFACAFANALPGVNPTAWQGFTCPRFVFDTDSWQGAEFLFSASGHTVACLGYPSCTTEIALPETLFVLLHLRQGFLVLVLGPDPLLAWGYCHRRSYYVDLHFIELLMAEVLQVISVEVLA